MINPFSGKWVVMCWRANHNNYPDKFFGFVTGHDPIFSECEPDECWYDEHQIPKLWNTKEELEKEFKNISSSYASYTPMQIP